MISTEWKDYEIIASGGGEKLERWKDIILLRPDPQAIWKQSFDFSKYDGLHARYVRSQSGGGKWEYYKQLPEKWEISWRNLRFSVMPMGFKHTGLFPEQALNWAKLTDIIKGSGRSVSVLNLFAYTGGATVACLAAGASVCHVDAAKAMVERAGDNVRLSGLDKADVRYIIDDCVKFVQREKRRGRKYDGIIMDPPSYGRGPGGEMWKIENDLYPLVELTRDILSDNPLFYLINSYTTGLQPQVIKNILHSAISADAQCEAYEVCLPTREKGIELPCGASALMRF